MPERRRGSSQVVGPYVILAPLGRGGGGVVYRARHQSSGQEVALKLLGTAPGTSEEVRREVHVLSRLRHPGIVRILRHGVFQETPWIAMELVEGEPLSEALRHRATR